MIVRAHGRNDNCAPLLCSSVWHHSLFQLTFFILIFCVSFFKELFAQVAFSSIDRSCHPKMWRELLWKTVGRSKMPAKRNSSSSYQPSSETASNSNSYDDDNSEDDNSTEQQSDSSGISGHYSFQHSSRPRTHSNSSLQGSQASPNYKHCHETKSESFYSQHTTQ